MNRKSPSQSRPSPSYRPPASTRRALHISFEQLVAVAAGIPKPITRSAAEVEGVAGTLGHLSSDELQSLPVVCAGERLIPGAVYLDLRALRAGTFSAPVEAYTGEHAWYVARADVEPRIWNRLLLLASADGGY